jgi:large subunit ribosomal protein L21
VYAIIQTGGKQYKVSEGDIVRVEKIEGDVGKIVEIRDVLLVSGPDGLRVGNPVVENASVIAEIIDHGRAKKVIVFKKKRRKGYKKKQGHRQPYTGLKIREIRV